MYDNPIEQVIKHFGGKTEVADIVGLSYMAINKWEKKGRFPRTDYTGETGYAQKLSDASNGFFSVDELLISYTKTPSRN